VPLPTKEEQEGQQEQEEQEEQEVEACQGWVVEVVEGALLQAFSRRLGSSIRGALQSLGFRV